jgi:hypothetical protein
VLGYLSSCGDDAAENGEQHDRRTEVQAISLQDQTASRWALDLFDLCSPGSPGSKGAAVSTPATTVGGEATSQPRKETIWNGEKLNWHNGLALRWAFQQGARLKSLGLGRREHLVLLCIAAHTDLDGHNRTWLNYWTIAFETGFGKTSACEGVQRLKAAKILTITEHSSGCNWYQIVPNVLARVVVQKLKGGACSSVADIVQGLNEAVSETERVVVQDQNRVVSETEPEEVPGTSTGEEGPGEVPATSAVVVNPLNRSDDTQGTIKAKAKATASSSVADSIIAEPAIAASGPSPASSISRPDPARSPSSVSFPATSGGRLAEEVWVTITSPRRELHAAKTAWPSRLTEIADRDGGADLLATLTAAMKLPYYGLGDADHDSQLPRRRGDSLDFILSDLDKMADDVDRQAKAVQRKLSAPVTASTRNHPLASEAEQAKRASVKSLFKIE